MKCVCGYEYSVSSPDGDKVIRIGDRPFIGLEIITSTNGSIAEISQVGGHIVKLYACPECKTLRIGD